MATIIKIGWLFPNTFNLHGDRGNMLALEFECRRRGYEPQIDKITLDTKDFHPLEYDVLFCPPGEMIYFETIIEYLKPVREEFLSFMEKRPLLVTGTSISLFGRLIKRDDGTNIEGLHLIDIEVEEKDHVYGDDLYFSCRYHGKEMKIIGNQIQMMNVVLRDESPFGLLHYGYGNTGETRFEGVAHGQAIFTNTLGPILVGNPWLTCEIVNLIEENKNLLAFDIERDNQLEMASMRTKTDLIEKKESHLIPVAGRIR
ncbi:cobalamin biosynthesis protein CobQ [Eubacteriaceae bacterium ES3]|nr:cobalamin biosynthesis protein CobQ [Eubacteriaceae bacterium ES3]